VYHLLIVNGWSANSHFWDAFIHDLPDAYSCQLIDLDSTMGLTDCCELIDSYVQDNTLLMGWSLGGMLAAKYAALSARRFLGLITLQASPCFVEKGGWPYALAIGELLVLRDVVKNHNLKLLVRNFSSLLVNGSKQYKVDRRQLKPVYTESKLCSVSALLSGLDLLLNLDLREDYQNINVPFMGLFGEQDALVSVRQVEDIKMLSPKHDFFVINDMAHFPCGAHRQQVIEHLKSFVDAL